MAIAESDWRRLRALSDVALERLCAMILDECDEIIDSSTVRSHERYLALYRHVRERDRDIADTFDQISRSTAIERLASMCALNLVHEEELASFSPETQHTVRTLLELAHRRRSRHA